VFTKLVEPTGREFGGCESPNGVHEQKFPVAKCLT